MTDKEIIEGLAHCFNMAEYSDCNDCSYRDTKGKRCTQALYDDVIDLINRQQVLLSGISQLITDNTYPTFDKDGKPVSVWNPDGYKQIEELLKGGTCNEQKM